MYSWTCKDTSTNKDIVCRRQNKENSRGSGIGEALPGIDKVIVTLCLGAGREVSLISMVFCSRWGIGCHGRLMGGYT